APPTRRAPVRTPPPPPGVAPPRREPSPRTAAPGGAALGAWRPPGEPGLRWRGGSGQHRGGATWGRQVSVVSHCPETLEAVDFGVKPALAVSRSSAAGPGPRRRAGPC